MPATYSRSAVVLVRYGWRDKDGKFQSKPRPCIVKEVLSADRYLVTKITTVNKADKLIFVKCSSKEGQEMGLLEDSYISLNETQEVRESEIIRKIGNCPVILFASI